LSVTITILGEAAEEMAGRVLSLTGAEIVFEAPIVLAEHAPLKLTWGKYAILCEVDRRQSDEPLTVASVHHFVNLDVAAERSQFWS
jgi:hypothetical protein